MPQTPVGRGVPEDVLEESEVVPKEFLVEGAMIAVRAAVPSPSHGAPAASSPAPHAAAAAGVVACAAAGLEVVLEHRTLYASDDIPLDEAVNTAHRALFQVQRVLRREGEGLADEHQRIQLWATRLKGMTVSERVAAQAW
jgi:hypothetical protein